MSDFENAPISTDVLPQLRGDDFQPVEKSFLRMTLAAVGLGAVLTLVVAVVVLVGFDASPAVTVAVLGVVVALAAVLAIHRVVEVRHLGYLVRAHDISYRGGVLNRVVATVPFVRVQHARIQQGPIQRRFGLATLEVNSAGPDLRLQGLGVERAERLKTLIVERAGDLAEPASPGP